MWTHRRQKESRNSEKYHLSEHILSTKDTIEFDQINVVAKIHKITVR